MTRESDEQITMPLQETAVLCSPCRSIFSGSYEAKFNRPVQHHRGVQQLHHPSLATFLHALDLGCVLCVKFYAVLPDKVRQQIEGKAIDDDPTSGQSFSQYQLNDTKHGFFEILFSVVLEDGRTGRWRKVIGLNSKMPHLEITALPMFFIHLRLTSFRFYFSVR